MRRWTWQGGIPRGVYIRHLFKRCQNSLYNHYHFISFHRSRALRASIFLKLSYLFRQLRCFRLGLILDRRTRIISKYCECLYFLNKIFFIVLLVLISLYKIHILTSYLLLSEATLVDME
jgi:hypothetical protein